MGRVQVNSIESLNICKIEMGFGAAISKQSPPHLCLHKIVKLNTIEQFNYNSAQMVTPLSLSINKYNTQRNT